MFQPSFNLSVAQCSNLNVSILHSGIHRRPQEVLIDYQTAEAGNISCELGEAWLRTVQIEYARVPPLRDQTTADHTHSNAPKYELVDMDALFKQYCEEIEDSLQSRRPTRSEAERL
ncbi:hypothetical protein BD779DRAFT_636492 [Infundibulicybe gibba]|nr:hypothetical protein BD779DRAFT_636492 [Infundibulicybe gibba]